MDKGPNNRRQCLRTLLFLAATISWLASPATAAVLPDLVPEITDPGVAIADVDPGDVIEGCAGGATNRLLLQYSIRTYNIGTADLVMGDPMCPYCPTHLGEQCGNPLFVCSTAHGHAHFESFANGELLDADYNVVASSRKYGFCLLDSECSDPFYSCSYQGLSAGCSDVYYRGLPCQYIDITDADLPAGTYTLRVRIDPDNEIPEADELNNVTEVPVTIGPSNTYCPRQDSSDVPKAVPDEGATSSVLDVTTEGWINSVSVVGLQVTHPNVGQLGIQLESAAGTTVDIVDHVCGGSSNLHLDLDNTASSAIPCPPTDGAAHKPSHTLATLLGEEAAGRWTLHVTDDQAGSSGELQAWGLEICTEIACASYGEFFATDLPKAIPDLTEISSSITVPRSAGLVGRVEVLGLKGTHTHVGDLFFHLVSPWGYDLTLINRVCGSNDDFNLSLSSLAGTAVPCPPTDGEAHMSNNAFTAFLGEPAEGKWTLKVQDRASQDVGTLDAWGLRICALESTAATCPETPLVGCRTADRGSVKMQMRSHSNNSRFSWQWRGGSTTKGQFGAPDVKTGYAACVYRDGELALSLPIGSNGLCDGRPCWRTLGSRAHKYRRRGGNKVGVSDVVLRSGDGDASIQVKAKGTGLRLPLPLSPTSDVKVQLIRSDSSLCWESDFPAPARHDSDTLFSEKTP